MEARVATVAGDVQGLGNKYRTEVGKLHDTLHDLGQALRAEIASQKEMIKDQKDLIDAGDQEVARRKETIDDQNNLISGMLQLIALLEALEQSAPVPSSSSDGWKPPPPPQVQPPPHLQRQP